MSKQALLSALAKANVNTPLLGDAVWRWWNIPEIWIGLARSVHGDHIIWRDTHSTGGGEEGSRPISLLKNEHGRGHTVAIDTTTYCRHLAFQSTLNFCPECPASTLGVTRKQPQLVPAPSLAPGVLESNLVTLFGLIESIDVTDWLPLPSPC